MAESVTITLAIWQKFELTLARKNVVSQLLTAYATTFLFVILNTKVCTLLHVCNLFTVKL